MSKGNKTKVYSRKTYPMTAADRERLENILQAERVKYERDRKCGGVSEYGYYIALHKRDWEE